MELWNNKHSMHTHSHTHKQNILSNKNILLLARQRSLCHGGRTASLNCRTVAVNTRIPSCTVHHFRSGLLHFTEHFLQHGSRLSGPERGNFRILTCQLECLTCLWDIFHMCNWENAHRQHLEHLEKGRPLKPQRVTGHLVFKLEQ